MSSNIIIIEKYGNVPNDRRIVKVYSNRKKAFHYLKDVEGTLELTPNYKGNAWLKINSYRALTVILKKDPTIFLKQSVYGQVTFFKVYLRMPE